MNNIIPFDFDGQTVRSMIAEDGTPLFVGKDVARALGYVDTVNALKQHCRGMAIHHHLQTPGGVQQARFITESDVYRLVVKSTLPEAVRFERWLFEDVLPSIRRTGQYGAFADMIPRTYSDALRLCADLTEKVEEQQRQLAEAAPKVAFVDRYVEADGYITFREMAKTFQVKENDLRCLLLDRKMIHYVNNRMMPMKAQEIAGRMIVKTGMTDDGQTYTSTYFTTKGVEYISRLLRQSLQAINDNYPQQLKLELASSSKELQ